MIFLDGCLEDVDCVVREISNSFTSAFDFSTETRFRGIHNPSEIPKSVDEKKREMYVVCLKKFAGEKFPFFLHLSLES